MVKIYLTDKKKAMEIVNNEAVKRFGEAKYYDGSLFGYDTKMILVIRHPEKIKEFLEDLEEINVIEGKKILEKIKEDEEKSALGVGMIFG